MSLGVLPIPLLVVFLLALTIYGFTYFQKSFSKKPNYLTIGAFIGSIGLLMQVIVIFEGKFHQFGVLEKVSVAIIAVGIYFFGLARYQEIKMNSSEKRKFFIKLGLAGLCLLVMLLLAVWK